jgi:hypothetical protein
MSHLATAFASLFLLALITAAQSRVPTPFPGLMQPQPNATTLRIPVEDPATTYIGSLIIPLSQIN